MYPEVNQSHLLRSVMSYFIILTQHNESNLLLRWTKQKKIIVHPIPFILRDKYFGIFWWNVKWKHCFLHQFCLTNVVVNAFILAIVNWSHGLPLFKSCQVSVEKQLKRTANWRSCVAGGKKKNTKHSTWQPTAGTTVPPSPASSTCERSPGGKSKWRQRHEIRCNYVHR